MSQSESSIEALLSATYEYKDIFNTVSSSTVVPLFSTIAKSQKLPYDYIGAQLEVSLSSFSDVGSLVRILHLASRVDSLPSHYYTVLLRTLLRTYAYPLLPIIARLPGCPANLVDDLAPWAEHAQTHIASRLRSVTTIEAQAKSSSDPLTICLSLWVRAELSVATFAFLSALSLISQALDCLPTTAPQVLRTILTARAVEITVLSLTVIPRVTPPLPSADAIHAEPERYQVLAAAMRDPVAFVTGLVADACTPSTPMGERAALHAVLLQAAAHLLSLHADTFLAGETSPDQQGYLVLDTLFRYLHALPDYTQRSFAPMQFADTLASLTQGLMQALPLTSPVHALFADMALAWRGTPTDAFRLAHPALYQHTLTTRADANRAPPACAPCAALCPALLSPAEARALEYSLALALLPSPALSACCKGRENSTSPLMDALLESIPVATRVPGMRVLPTKWSYRSDVPFFPWEAEIPTRNFAFSGLRVCVASVFGPLWGGGALALLWEAFLSECRTVCEVFQVAELAAAARVCEVSVEDMWRAVRGHGGSQGMYASVSAQGRMHVVSGAEGAGEGALCAGAGACSAEVDALLGGYGRGVHVLEATTEKWEENMLFLGFPEMGSCEEDVGEDADALFYRALLGAPVALSGLGGEDPSVLLSHTHATAANGGWEAVYPLFDPFAATSPTASSAVDVAVSALCDTNRDFLAGMLQWAPADALTHTTHTPQQPVARAAAVPYSASAAYASLLAAHVTANDCADLAQLSASGALKVVGKKRSLGRKTVATRERAGPSAPGMGDDAATADTDVSATRATTETEVAGDVHFDASANAEMAAMAEEESGLRRKRRSQDTEDTETLLSRTSSSVMSALSPLLPAFLSPTAPAPAISPTSAISAPSVASVVCERLQQPRADTRIELQSHAACASSPSDASSPVQMQSSPLEAEDVATTSSSSSTSSSASAPGQSPDQPPPSNAAACFSTTALMAVLTDARKEMELGTRETRSARQGGGHRAGRQDRYREAALADVVSLSRHDRAESALGPIAASHLGADLFASLDDEEDVEVTPAMLAAALQGLPTEGERMAATSMPMGVHGTVSADAVDAAARQQLIVMKAERLASTWMAMCLNVLAQPQTHASAGSGLGSTFVESRECEEEDEFAVSADSESAFPALVCASGAQELEGAFGDAQMAARVLAMLAARRV